MPVRRSKTGGRASFGTDAGPTSNDDTRFNDAAPRRGATCSTETPTASQENSAGHADGGGPHPDDTSPGPPGGQTALLPLAEGPCPSCTALLDQLDGAAGHVSQHVNLAVAAKAPLDRVLTFAAERGWRRLRLLSSASTTYNRDYLAETADGSQQPMLNVFHRDGQTIRHFWGSELFYAPVDPGQEPRHVGTIEPLWNAFDLTREGRPADWHEQFSY